MAISSSLDLLTWRLMNSSIWPTSYWNRKMLGLSCYYIIIAEQAHAKLQWEL